MNDHRHLALLLILVEVVCFVALSYVLFSWFARVIAQVIA